MMIASAVTPGDVSPPLSALSSHGSTHGARVAQRDLDPAGLGVAAVAPVDVVDALLLGLLERERQLAARRRRVPPAAVDVVVVVVTATADERDDADDDDDDERDRSVALQRPARAAAAAVAGGVTCRTWCTWCCHASPNEND